MKTKMTTVLLAALGALALTINAQDNNPPPGGPPPDGAGGPGAASGQRGGGRPPMPAIIKALDVNHDGVIDSNEIANASAALKTLDKNGDGKLTRDEFMGPRPQRPPGGPNGQSQGTDGINPPPGEGDGNNHPPGPPPGDK